MISEAWATDFLPNWVDTDLLEIRKPSNLERFIRYCHSQNIGFLALALCIAGADQFEVLGVLCGLKSETNNRKQRSDTDKLDLNKLIYEMGNRGFTHKTMCAAIHRSKGTIARMVYDNQGKRFCHKSKRFIADCENALGLNKGELIYKEGKNEDERPGRTIQI